MESFQKRARERQKREQREKKQAQSRERAAEKRGRTVEPGSADAPRTKASDGVALGYFGPEDTLPSQDRKPDER
jgi:hypothetical protein